MTVNLCEQTPPRTVRRIEWLLGSDHPFTDKCPDVELSFDGDHWVLTGHCDCDQSVTELVAAIRRAGSLERIINQIELV